MEVDEAVVDIQKVTKNIYGSYVIGRLCGSVEKWWSEWSIIEATTLPQILSSINVVFNMEEPELSGIITVMYYETDNMLVVVVPSEPLFFGVRLALVHASNRMVYYKLDLDVYVDLPLPVASCIAGIIARYHDPNVFDSKPEQEWINKNKSHHLGSDLTVWSVFVDAYVAQLHKLAPRYAYNVAVQMTIESVEAINQSTAFARFKENVNNANGNLMQIINTLKTVDEMPHSSEFRRIADILELARRIYVKFPDNVSSINNEIEILHAAIDMEIEFTDTMQKIDQINFKDFRDLDTIVSLAVTLIKQEHNESALSAVLYSIQTLRVVPSNDPLKYDTHCIDNVSLKKKLENFVKDRSQPTNVEKAAIAKALEFVNGQTLLQWKLNDFVNVAEYHKKTAKVACCDESVGLKERVVKQLESEKNGLFYRRQLKELLLKRNDIAIEQYVQALRKWTNENEKIEKVFENEMTKTFKRLSYWNLITDMAGVQNSMRELANFMTFLGSITAEQTTWLDQLPVTANQSSGLFFSSSMDVRNYVDAFESFRKPDPAKLPYMIAELNIEVFNSVIGNSSIGNKLVKIWKDQVQKPWQDEMAKIKKAETTYEQKVEHILQIAKEMPFVHHVYAAFKKKCSTDRAVWWDFVENVLRSYLPEVFNELARISDRDVFLDRVMENNWKVSLASDDKNVVERVSKVALFLLKRAHDLTCKAVLQTFDKNLAEIVADLKLNWSSCFKNIDQSVDDFYDTTFIAKMDNVKVKIKSDQYKSMLQPEIKRVLFYVSRVYGLEELAKDIFNWIAYGYSRWLVTDHMSVNFDSAHGFVDIFQNPASSFYALVTSLLIELLGVHAACFTNVVEKLDNCACDVYQILTTSFPFYARIQSQMTGWTTAYGESTTHSVDLFEMIPPLPKYSNVLMETCKTTDSQNLELTKLIMKEFTDDGVDIIFAQMCLNGRVWNEMLYKFWGKCRTTWFANARDLVFDENNKKLQYAVNDRSTVHSLKAVLNEQCQQFVELYRTASDIEVHFERPVTLDEQLPPTLEGKNLLNTIADASSEPDVNVDDFYLEDDIVSFWLPVSNSLSLREEIFAVDEAFLQDIPIDSDDDELESLTDEVADQVSLVEEPSLLEDENLQVEHITEQLDQIRIQSPLHTKVDAEVVEEQEEPRRQPIVITVRSKNFRRQFIALNEFNNYVRSLSYA